MHLPLAKILHIAPLNTAGMPYDFSLMQQRAGHESRLVTLYKNTLNFPEDISLNLPLPTGSIAKKWRDKKMTSRKPSSAETIKYYNAKGTAEKFFFKFRDFKNSYTIEKLIEKNNLLDYDIYHFDGGMDFYRDMRFAKSLFHSGKKIVCCYYGSDLRTRGIFKELDEMSSLNLTVEFDHLALKKDINYLFFPFDTDAYQFKINKNERVRIIHSPTNRLFKGTDIILKVIEEVKKERDFEFILTENMDRNKVLEIKRTCDLAIDQVAGAMGGSGYGKNSIENISMGIVTFTEFSDDYLEFLTENPFVHSTAATLKNNLIRFIDDEKLRTEKAHEGRAWAEKYHSFPAVNTRLEELYKRHNII